MNCEQARERMAERWVSGIGEDVRMALEGHLAGCAECRREAASLDVLWQGLGEMPVEEPGRNVRRGFEQMMEAYRMGVEAGGGRAKRPAWPVWQWAVAAAALVVVGAGTGHWMSARNEEQQQVRQLHAEMREMRQMVTLSLLQQQSASERLRGVSFGARTEGADQEVLGALLTALNTDSSVNVRLAAVEALRQFSGQARVRQGLRAALLAQESPLVQAALVDWAVEANDRGAVKVLRQMERDTRLDPSVRESVTSAVKRLE